jgi:hypothetical protein
LREIGILAHLEVDTVDLHQHGVEALQRAGRQVGAAVRRYRHRGKERAVHGGVRRVRENVLGVAVADIDGADAAAHGSSRER